jgi:hypothetical protein
MWLNNRLKNYFMQIWLQFTDHGIEGVVPLELLPPDVRSKYQAKPNDKSKRAKKDDTKGAAPQVEENQVSFTIVTFAVYCFLLGCFISVNSGS